MYGFIGPLGKAVELNPIQIVFWRTTLAAVVSGWLLRGDLRTTRRSPGLFDQKIRFHTNHLSRKFLVVAVKGRRRAADVERVVRRESEREPESP